LERLWALRQPVLETNKAELLHQTSKIVEEPLTWKPHSQGYRMEASVYAPELEEELRLVCSYGKTNFGFCLLYRNHPVRRYDNSPRHKSHTTGEVFLNTPHKHIWTQEDEDDQAYIPPDISPTDDVNDRLLSFLREENIEAKGGYQRLMIDDNGYL
jgi:hypothetical protein